MSLCEFGDQRGNRDNRIRGGDNPWNNPPMDRWGQKGPPRSNGPPRSYGPPRSNGSYPPPRSSGANGPPNSNGPPGFNNPHNDPPDPNDPNDPDGPDDPDDPFHRQQRRDCCCIHQKQDRFIRREERLWDMQDKQENKDFRQAESDDRKRNSELTIDLKLMDLTPWEPERNEQSFKSWYSMIIV